MHRAFKFRFWDKGLQVFGYPRQFQSGLSFVFSDPEYRSSYSASYESLFSDNCRESLVVTQFTGLLDKNGKEIYEGDILRVKLIIYQGTKREEVQHEFVGVCFYSINQAFFGIHWPEQERVFIFKSQSAEYEVIGNIFENSDLIS